MKNKKTTPKEIKLFDIKKELEFWSQYEYKEDVEKNLLERLVKIKSEDFKRHEVEEVATQVERIIPKEILPIFYLKLYVELPKKDCVFSSVFKSKIADLSKSYLLYIDIENAEIDDIGKNICSGKYSEKQLSKILRDWNSKLTLTGLSSDVAVAILYMYIIMSCEIYSPSRFDDNSFIVEKCFVETFRSTEKKSKEYIRRCVPKAIARKIFESSFYELSFLYHDINDEIETKDKRINALISDRNKLVADNISKDKIIESKSQEILQLQETLKDTKMEVEQLEKDLVAKDKMLKYEKNKYSEQYNTKAGNLLEELERNIGLELQGIEDVAERLPDREREKILKRIKKIRDKAGKMGGEI